MLYFSLYIINTKYLVIFIVLVFLGLVIFTSLIYYLSKKLLLLANIPNQLLPPLNSDELNKDLESFGFAYDSNQDMFYSVLHPWQRKYGYCKAYDDAAPLISLIIDCEPIYFKYNNRSWLIEFWKGQYGMTTGGEIGIYVSNDNQTSTSEILYQSITDQELIQMSYILKKKKNVLITRNSRHWWITGFKLGEFSKPSDLVMDITLTLPNQVMRDAFIIGLKKAGYRDKHFKVENNTIYLIYNKPFTKQPKAKNKLVTLVAQNYNKNNCKLYNTITKNYNNSLDKINYIRELFPILYSHIMNSGKTEEFFKKYQPPQYQKKGGQHEYIK